MVNFVKCLLPICVALLISAELNAQSSQSRVQQLIAMNLGELLKVGIATGSPVEIDKAPAVATVITSAQIESMGARNLIEVLDSVPGLHVGRNDQNMAPRFAFRGIITTFTPQPLVLVNGVSLKSVVRGGSHTVWGEFPVRAISRIEVLRGPGSALYGADAFSGVINIITKNADDIEHSEVGAMAGSFDTYNLWANHATQIGDWKLALNLEYLASDGYEELIESDAQTNLDLLGDALFVAGALPFDPADASLAPANLSMGFKTLHLWAQAENQYVDLMLGIQDLRDNGVGQGATEALDLIGRTASYKHLFKATLKPLPLSEALNFSSELHFYRSSQEIENRMMLFPPGAFFGAFADGFIGNPGWQEDSLKWESKFHYSGWQGHQLDIGLGYGLQDLYEVTETKNFNPDLTPTGVGLIDVSDTPDVFMPEDRRENFFVYIQDVVNLAEDWTLTAGIRYDNYTDFGSTTNPRLALVWAAQQDLTIKALFGKAFRAPGFAETLTVNNPVSLGNPDIKPELMTSWELAANYQIKENLLLGVNLFHYDLKDLIDFVPDTDAPIATAQNVGERSGKGAEIEARYTPTDNVSLLANYSYVKACQTGCGRLPKPSGIHASKLAN